MLFLLHFKFFFLFIFGINCNSKSNEELEHTTIVLIGATGDLSKRFLWKAFYNNFASQFSTGNRHFSFYGVGLSPIEKGRQSLADILLNSLKCYDENCRNKKKKFVENVQYIQLKSEKQYKQFGKRITENIQGAYGITDPDRTVETGRIVYMAIPPNSYKNTAKLVNKYLRPSFRKTWFRIVFEKPFGKNLQNSEELNSNLKKHFKEEEIYIVDHYLGKSVANLILPFRFIHKMSYETLWNKNYIDRVEISSMESIDVKGRTNFYDDVGVFRDMFQNHLTEMMTLVTMQLPSDSSKINQLSDAKLNILKTIPTVKHKHVLHGQYAKYNDQLVDEKTRNISNRSNTATFGSAVLYSNHPRWKNVPFIFTSGKHLPEKSSYIKIMFKSNSFCLSNYHICNEQKQIVFYLGGTDIRLPPCIIITGKLPEIIDSSQWKIEAIPGSWIFLGANISNSKVLLPTEESDSYTILINALYEANRHKFVDTNRLLESWRIWTPVIRLLDNELPRIYQTNNIKLLDFEIRANGGLSFLHFPSIIEHNENNYKENIPNIFRDSKLILGCKDSVVKQLANHIEKHMLHYIETRDVFHIAFSGGSTQLHLFDELAERYWLPWDKVNIWQIDERCVDWEDENSNFKLINDHLLKHIQIDFKNIHSIPIYLFDKVVCSNGEQSSIVYEESIKRILTTGHFDYIVLGIGNDCHTASLFPNDKKILDTNKHVIFTENVSEDKHVRKRISVSFKVLNSSNNVGILVIGDSKKDIIKKLKSKENFQTLSCPITGILNNNLTWYIDEKSYNN